MSAFVSLSIFLINIIGFCGPKTYVISDPFNMYRQPSFELQDIFWRLMIGLYLLLQTVIIVPIIVLGIKGFLKQWLHMLRHRKAHDDGSPYHIHRLPRKGVTGGLVC